MNKKRAVDVTLFLLRVVAGIMILEAGGVKLFGWFGGVPGGQPPMMSQLGIAGVLEVLGGCYMIVGLFTQPTAFILSGEMAVAYFQVHQPKGIWPIQNHGEQAVLFCFIFLAFAAIGGGPWSIDELIRRKRSLSRRGE